MPLIVLFPGCVLFIALFVWPGLWWQGRELSRKLECLQNLARINVALQKYGGSLPPDPDKWLTRLVELEAITEYQCVSPASGKRYRFIIPVYTQRNDEVAYIYAPLAEGRGGNILFVDGHASSHSPEVFREIISRSEHLSRTRKKVD